MLLLKAALAPGKSALQAWDEWRARVDLDDIDAGSFRLLPLVHVRLAALPAVSAATEPDRGRLRGVHRRAWYRNQLLIGAARPVLEDMQTAGFAPVLLKGCALAITVYGDAGARPMADIDVLVHPRNALDAGRLLEARGFAPQYRFDAKRVRTLNAVGFVAGPRGGTATATAAVGAVDLHWHLLPEPCASSFDDEVHSRARPAVLHGLPVLVLDATDELLVACAHGVRWNPVPPLRWAADAHLLITQAREGIAWNRLVETAARHGLTLPVLGALRYVAATLGTPVPAWVPGLLERVPPTLGERTEYVLRQSPVADRLFGELPAYWLRWMRRSRDQSPLARLRGFPAYLAECWGCEGAHEVRALAFDRMKQRLRSAPALLRGDTPVVAAEDKDR